MTPRYQGASIILLTPDKKIILQNRKSSSKFGEEYAFFGGGREECDESLLHTALREAKEELGLELSGAEFLLEYTCDFRKGADGSRLGPARIAAFIAPGFFDPKELTILEGDGAEAFTIDEAKSLKVFSDMHHILHALEGYITLSKP